MAKAVDRKAMAALSASRHAWLQQRSQALSRCVSRPQPGVWLGILLAFVFKIYLMILDNKNGYCAYLCEYTVYMIEKLSVLCKYIFEYIGYFEMICQCIVNLDI